MAEATPSTAVPRSSEDYFYAHAHGAVASIYQLRIEEVSGSGGADVAIGGRSVEVLVIGQVEDPGSIFKFPPLGQLERLEDIRVDVEEAGGVYKFGR